MKSIQQLQREMEQVKEHERELNVAISQARGNKTFVCHCGKRHKFNQCDGIQRHYYVPPSGCTDGDYWLESDLLISCPNSTIFNRMLFMSNYNSNIPYEKRKQYEYNIEQQFKLLYRPVLKSLKAVYRAGNDIPSINNEHVDKNYAKYGLTLPEQ